MSLELKLVLSKSAKKDQTSVRPKPGFGIGNRNQGPISVSVSEPKLFFPKPKLQNFSNFLIFFCLGDIPCGPSMMYYPETGRGGFWQVSRIFY